MKKKAKLLEALRAIDNLSVHIDTLLQREVKQLQIVQHPGLIEGKLVA